MTEQNGQPVNPEEKDEFVSKKAYSEVTTDMHKYKSKLKETEALLNQLKAEKEAQEIEEKKAKQEWELLYKSEAQKREQLERERTEEKSKFLDYHKKQALISKLGGFKKDEYACFVNVNSIQLDDSGNIVEDTLEAEVNRIRQNYSDLLKTQTSVTLPNEAPKSFNATQEVDLRNMTEKERNAYKMSLIKNKGK